MSARQDFGGLVFDGLRRYGIEMDRQTAALRLRGDEVKLAASFKGMTFRTTRGRSRHLVHLAERCFSVWRPDGDSHVLMRVVAHGFCGQWIVSAQPASWAADPDSRCESCLAVARRIVGEQAEQETATAARIATEDRTAAAVQTFVDAGLVQPDAIVEVDF